MTRIRGLVFDAYGTLFDVHSIGKLAESIYPGSGTAISALWRDKQIEYSRLISLSDPDPNGSRYYQSFWNLTEAALSYSLPRLGLPNDKAQFKALMDQYTHLEAFPECADILKVLSYAGLPMVVLSNGSPAMLQTAAQSSGLNQFLKYLISVDQIRQFKTSPQAYGLASKKLGIETKNLFFVSSNGWDVIGASWYGFPTCWINRANHPFETIGRRPSFCGSDLSIIVDVVNQNSDAR